MFSKITISLGTTSEEKKEIFVEVLKKFGFKAEIFSCSVETGIVDQPLGETAIIKGAQNRALNSLLITENSETQIGVGLEGGLVKINNLYYLVCAAVIVKRSNKKIFLGVSSKLALPKEVSEKIDQGEQFGQVIRHFYNQHSGESSIRELTASLISRKNAFNEAITNALSVFSNETYY